MLYDIKEYKYCFDTPAKKQQEKVIVSKIMDLLNKNKYDNFDGFIAKNDNYQDFLKQNKLDAVIKHFGNTLTETDYKKILEQIKNLIKSKNSFQTDTINTTKIGESEYNSFVNGEKTIHLDNSIGNKPITDQMKDLQPQQVDFQTSNPGKNTENMMQELAESKKENLNFVDLAQIDRDKLNPSEMIFFNIAINFQLEHNCRIKIDLNKGVIIDEQNNIMKIINQNGNYIVQGESSSKQVESPTQTKESKERQLVLTPKKDTLYN